MKAFDRRIAIGAALLGLASLGLSPASRAAGSNAAGYPSFCAIPPTPTGVRTAAQFKSAVLSLRQAGLYLGRRTAPGEWSLEGGEAFAAGARAEAAPPPPIDAADAADTEAFAAAARAAVKSPRR